MSKVEVVFEEIELELEHRTVDGTLATYSRGDHTAESVGTGGGSYRRCLALMREECPRGEEYDHVDPDADDGPPPTRRGVVPERPNWID
jgi:hypothetical protein